jgi:integrase/recombinase XerD
MTPVTLPPSGHAAWDDLASWWLSRYRLSTQRTYATYLPRWNRWCAGRRIDPLAARRADVELWLHTVGDSGLSRASIAAHYDAVASLYRLAYEEELVAANPCARVARPKIHRELQRREVLTVLEYAAFLTTARHLTPSHHAIAVLGGMMGLRATEMATLAVESFGTVRGYATLLVMGKGDKPARVPVPIPALGAVQAAIRPHLRAPAAHSQRCRHGPPKRAPLRRRDRQGRRDHLAHRPTRAAPNRRHRRAQPGHPAAGCPATATPRPPRDHAGQL